MTGFIKRQLLPLLAVLATAGAVAAQPKPLPPIDLDSGLFVPTVDVHPPAPAGVPNYCILTVGVSRYRDVVDVAGADQDARRIADLFKGLGGRVIDVLQNERATHKNVRAALDDLTETTRQGELVNVKPGEVVVIALAGHGMRKGGNWAFLPHDYTPGRPSSALDTWTILSTASFLMGRGHTVVLVLDCCFAGEIRHTPAWATYIRDAEHNSSSATGLALFAACAPSQSSWGNAASGRFTQAFLEALSGKADLNRDRQVTIREVNQYLAWRLREIEYKRPKLPGLPWNEQDHLSVITPGIPETQVLGRGDGNPLPPGEDLNTKPGLAPDVRAGEASPVGTWRMTKRLSGTDGKVFEESFTLQFRADGRYMASRRDSLGVRQVATGEYVFEPGSIFRLDYDNGSDDVRVDEISADKLNITVYPLPAYRGVSYQLSRVKTP